MRDEIDRLMALYETRAISRRGVVEAVTAMCLASGAAGKAAAQPPQATLVRARTLNHVSITTADVGRSKAFYSRLTGLPVQTETPGVLCEFRLENGFLGLYSQKAEPAQQNGLNHVCLGIDGYDPKGLVADLKRSIPEAKPVVEFGNQVYVYDPDGVKVQFADVNYKR